MRGVKDREMVPLVCVGCYRVAVRFWVLLTVSKYVCARMGDLGGLGDGLDCDWHRARVGMPKLAG